LTIVRGRGGGGHGGEAEDGRIGRDEAQLGETTGETGAQFGGGDVGGRHGGEVLSGSETGRKKNERSFLYHTDERSC
jgi:hypothetical protein